MTTEKGRLVSEKAGKTFRWLVFVPTKKGGEASMPPQAAELGDDIPSPSAGAVVDVEFERGPAGLPVRIRRAGATWVPHGSKSGHPAVVPPAPLQIQIHPAAGGAHGNNAQQSTIVEVEVAQGAGAPKVNRVTLQNGSVFHGNHLDPALKIQSQIDIAEVATCQGAGVRKDGSHRGKWYRPDYSSVDPDCYPYNFVRATKAPGPITSPIIGKTPEERLASLLGAHPECDRSWLDAGLHTGSIDIVLTVLSPTIVSHPPGADDLLPREETEALTGLLDQASTGEFGTADLKREGGRWARETLQRVRPPAFDGTHHVVPATSLKGMLRTVVESLTHSYSPFVTSDLEGQDPKALAHRRGRWGNPVASATPPISNEADLSQYTYDFAVKKAYRGWTRWINKNASPYALLAHVDGERHPDASTLADRMFGRVAESGWPSLAGRVIVRTGLGTNEDGSTSTKAADDYWFLKPLTTPAGARAKCEALYLLPSVGTVTQYGSATAEFRGRKRYWPHSLGSERDAGARTLTQIRDLIVASPTTAPWETADVLAAVRAFRGRVEGHRNSQPATKSWLKPLLPGSRFRFRVDFTNLTDVELGALLKAIVLFNESDGALGSATHVHRLGRAKPLGFGSVVLSIRGLRLRDIAAAYSSFAPIESCWLDQAEVGRRRTAATDALGAFCGAWKTPVWDQFDKLTRIPATLTDYDYWKNWSDFNPATAVPLSVP